jgi:hypothetical protein
MTDKPRYIDMRNVDSLTAASRMIDNCIGRGLLPWKLVILASYGNDSFVSRFWETDCKIGQQFTFNGIPVVMV